MEGAAKIIEPLINSRADRYALDHIEDAKIRREAYIDGAKGGCNIMYAYLNQKCSLDSLFNYLYPNEMPSKEDAERITKAWDNGDWGMILMCLQEKEGE